MSVVRHLKSGTELHETESADASQVGALPSFAVPKTVSNAGGFRALGLASSEKQIPQIVETVANSKHGMERLEWLGCLQSMCSPSEPRMPARAHRQTPKPCVRLRRSGGATGLSDVPARGSYARARGVRDSRLTRTRLIARVHSGLPLLCFSFERYPVRVPLFDTVEVCGSSPHGPTISFNNIGPILPSYVAPYCSNKSLNRCTY
jgi:hypothetical protein